MTIVEAIGVARGRLEAEAAARCSAWRGVKTWDASVVPDERGLAMILKAYAADGNAYFAGRVIDHLTLQSAKFDAIGYAIDYLIDRLSKTFN